MPWTKGASDLSEFLHRQIMDQHEGGLSRRKIAGNLSIPLSTVNRVIVQFTREEKSAQNLIQVAPGPLKEPCVLLKEMLKRILGAKPLTLQHKLVSVPEQLSGIFTSWATMVELREENLFFILPISSAEKIGLVRWWIDLWPFGPMPFSLMSHNLHYFPTVEGYGGSLSKSLTLKDCSQRWNMGVSQLWYGVQFGVMVAQTW